MAVGYAYKEFPEDIGNTQLDLQNAFGISHNAPILLQENAPITNEAETSEDQLETFDMPPPWEKSIHEKLTEMIKNYDFDEAIKLLATYMNHPSEEYRNGIYKALERSLDSLFEGGFGYQIQEFKEFGIQNSYGELGMNYDFFNTGPNADDEFEGPVVETNRYAVERHFENEKFKPPQLVQPYLGLHLG